HENQCKLTQQRQTDKHLNLIEITKHCILIKMNLVGLIIDWSPVQVWEGPPNFERRSRLVPTTPFLYLMVLSVAMGTPLAPELIFLSPL
ncbi:hypothetical protein CA163_34195, partial [Vibrio parahaemolyticus]